MSTFHQKPGQSRKTTFWQRASRGFAGAATLFGGVSVWQYYHLRNDYVPLTPPKGALHGVEEPDVKDGDKKNLEEIQILFLGDSLVIGIGCPDRQEGPVFARHISRVAARALKKRVCWRVLGIDGGDVNSMREKLVKEMEETVGKDSSKVTAVVIMCGLNDYKRLVQEGRMPSSFKEDLRKLIREIKIVVGEQARIVLPALPIDRAPLFKPLFPLNQILYKVAKIWDHQKHLLSGEENEVKFIREPEHYKEDDWAIDGIHPSEKGYRNWADHIVKKMLPGLENIHSGESNSGL